ncbi:site-2 protease family protein [Candidatus Parcubacteria bacterium]|nr:site-2 protease family protein [Candidatus Parcubacteria bacterium]
MFTAILFLVVLTILVFVHELGHFLIAKWAKVRVDEFAIGFPPRIFSWTRGETTYALNLLPFGGYVKIFGENPDEAVEGDKRNFAAQHRLVQAAILLGGVLFNFLFAWILFASALTLGLTVPVDYSGSLPLKDVSVQVVSTLPGSPAEQAGLRTGDEIIGMDTAGAKLDDLSVEGVQAFIATHPGEPVSFHLKRGSNVGGSIIIEGGETISVTPVEGVVSGKAAIGVSLAELGTLELGVGAAIVEGAKMTGRTTYGVATGLWGFLSKAFAGNASVSEVTGPVGIATLVGHASEFGFAYLLGFAAFISVNLGVINLIPFPALDGGRLLFVGIEGLLRRSLNPRILTVTNAIGFVLLILLMLVVTFKDVSGLLR